MATLNILVVDDEPNVLRSLKRLFIDTDYRVFTASSGEEGLEVLAREPVALVISDYRMPKMNGVQFLARVKEQYPDTIRIILSGYADVAAIVEAINEGHVYKFLAKPWNDQELLTTIQRSFEHFTLQSENLALLNELRTANEALKQLTGNLEDQIDQRTRDLIAKNRALETTHRILNHLPAGVLGIDSDGNLVYVNRELSAFLDTSRLLLGEPVDTQLEEQVLKTISLTDASGGAASAIIDLGTRVRVVCSQLPDNSGTVCLLTRDGAPVPDFSETTERVKRETTHGG